MVARPKYEDTLLKYQGNTVDIQDYLMQVSLDNLDLQTKKFAKQYQPTYESMKQLFRDVDRQITYREDDEGVQWLREPARFWADQTGDCKSFTLFMVSVFQNLGLDYEIRFAAYIRGSRTVTHVYPVVFLGSREVIMDVVYKRFDKQKTPTYLEKYKYKKMQGTNIYRLSGLNGIGATDWNPEIAGIAGEYSDPEIGAAVSDMVFKAQAVAKMFEMEVKNLETAKIDLTTLSEGEMNRFFNAKMYEGVAAKATGKAKIEAKAVADALMKGKVAYKKMSGIGSTTGMVDAFLQQQAQNTAPAYEFPTLNFGNLAEAVQGLEDEIGKTNILTKIGKKAKEALKKVGDAIKKAIAKLINWVMQSKLPAASPFFMLAMVKDKLSPALEKKKAKQVAQLNFMAAQTKMPVEKLKLAISAGIAKKTGRTPEQLINELKNQSAVEGIGVLPLAALVPLFADGNLLANIGDILKKIIALFKPKSAPILGKEDGTDLEELADDLAPVAYEATESENLEDEAEMLEGVGIVSNYLSKNRTKALCNSGRYTDIQGRGACTKNGGVREYYKRGDWASADF